MFITYFIRTIAFTTCIIFTSTTLTQSAPGETADMRASLLQMKSGWQGLLTRMRTDVFLPSTQHLTPSTSYDLAPKPLSEVIKDINNLLKTVQDPLRRAQLQDYALSLLSKDRPGESARMRYLRAMGQEQDDARYSQVVINTQGELATQERSVTLSKEEVEEIVKILGEAVRTYLTELVPYLNNRTVVPNVHRRIWKDVELFHAHPERFTNDELIQKNGGARLLLYKNMHDGVSGVAYKGVNHEAKRWLMAQSNTPGQIQALAERLCNYNVHIMRNTIDVTHQGVNKALPLMHLRQVWGEVLDTIGYTPGTHIDSRKTNTVMAFDGDSTLYRAATMANGGTFAASPAHKDCIQFMEMGGVCVLITGNDLHLVARRIIHDNGLPQHLRNRFILVANGGADMAYFNTAGDLVEIPSLRLEGLSNLERKDARYMLDGIYIGDHGSKDANDYAAFETIGFGRSILVSSQPKEAQLSKLQQNYLGHEEYGTAAFFAALNDQLKYHEKFTPIFTQEGIASSVQCARQLLELEGIVREGSVHQITNEFTEKSPFPIVRHEATRLRLAIYNGLHGVDEARRRGDGDTLNEFTKNEFREVRSAAQKAYDEIDHTTLNTRRIVVVRDEQRFSHERMLLAVFGLAAIITMLAYVTGSIDTDFLQDLIVFIVLGGALGIGELVHYMQQHGREYYHEKYVKAREKGKDIVAVSLVIGFGLLWSAAMIGVVMGMVVKIIIVDVFFGKISTIDQDIRVPGIDELQEQRGDSHIPGNPAYKKDPFYHPPQGFSSVEFAYILAVLSVGVLGMVAAFHFHLSFLMTLGIIISLGIPVLGFASFGVMWIYDHIAPLLNHKNSMNVRNEDGFIAFDFSFPRMRAIARSLYEKMMKAVGRRPMVNRESRAVSQPGLYSDEDIIQLVARYAACVRAGSFRDSIEGELKTVGGRIVPYVRDMVLHNAIQQEEHAVMRVLGKIGGPLVEAFFIECLFHESARVRMDAYEYLLTKGKCSPQLRAIKWGMDLMSHTQLDRARRELLSLGIDVQYIYERALSSPYRAVRIAAVQALASLTHESTDSFTMRFADARRIIGYAVKASLAPVDDPRIAVADTKWDEIQSETVQGVHTIFAPYDEKLSAMSLPWRMQEGAPTNDRFSFLRGTVALIVGGILLGIGISLDTAVASMAEGFVMPSAEGNTSGLLVIVSVICGMVCGAQHFFEVFDLFFGGPVKKRRIRQSYTQRDNFTINSQSARVRAREKHEKELILARVYEARDRKNMVELCALMKDHNLLLEARVLALKYAGRIAQNLTGDEQKAFLQELDNLFKKHDYKVMYMEAADVFSNMGVYTDERDIKMLGRMLSEDSSRLIKYGNKAVPELGRILNSNARSGIEQKIAAQYLGEIGGDEALGYLLKKLPDGYTHVQRAIVDALCKIGDKRALPGLVSVLRDDDFELVSHVKHGIERIVTLNHGALSLSTRISARYLVHLHAWSWGLSALFLGVGILCAWGASLPLQTLLFVFASAFVMIHGMAYLLNRYMFKQFETMRETTTGASTVHTPAFIALISYGMLFDVSFLIGAFGLLCILFVIKAVTKRSEAMYSRDYSEEDIAVLVPLIIDIQHRFGEARFNAVSSLGEREDPLSVPALLLRTADSSEELRASVRTSIARINKYYPGSVSWGERIYGAVMSHHTWCKDTGWVVWFIVYRPLVAVLAWSMEYFYTQALTRAAHEWEEDVLERGLRHFDEKIRAASVRELERREGYTPQRQLMKYTTDLRAGYRLPVAIKRLSQIGDHALPVLEGMIGDETCMLKSRIAAISVLQKINSHEADLLLMDVLMHGAPPLRDAASYALGRKGSYTKLPELLISGAREKGGVDPDMPAFRVIKKQHPADVSFLDELYLRAVAHWHWCKTHPILATLTLNWVVGGLFYGVMTFLHDRSFQKVRAYYREARNGKGDLLKIVVWGMLTASFLFDPLVLYASFSSSGSHGVNMLGDGGAMLIGLVLLGMMSIVAAIENDFAELSVSQARKNRENAEHMKMIETALQDNTPEKLYMYLEKRKIASPIRERAISVLGEIAVSASPEKRREILKELDSLYRKNDWKSIYKAAEKVFIALNAYTEKRQIRTAGRFLVADQFQAEQREIVGFKEKAIPELSSIVMSKKRTLADRKAAVKYLMELRVDTSIREQVGEEAFLYPMMRALSYAHEPELIHVLVRHLMEISDIRSLPVLLIQMQNNHPFIQKATKEAIAVIVEKCSAKISIKERMKMWYIMHRTWIKVFLVVSGLLLGVGSGITNGHLMVSMGAAVVISLIGALTLYWFDKYCFKEYLLETTRILKEHTTHNVGHVSLDDVGIFSAGGRAAHREPEHLSRVKNDAYKVIELKNDPQIKTIVASAVEKVKKQIDQFQLYGVPLNFPQVVVSNINSLGLYDESEKVIFVSPIAAQNQIVLEAVILHEYIHHVLTVQLDENEWYKARLTVTPGMQQQAEQDVIATAIELRYLFTESYRQDPSGALFGEAIRFLNDEKNAWGIKAELARGINLFHAEKGTSLEKTGAMTKKLAEMKHLKGAEMGTSLPTMLEVVRRIESKLFPRIQVDNEIAEVYERELEQLTRIVRERTQSEQSEKRVVIVDINPEDLHKTMVRDILSAHENALYVRTDKGMLAEVIMQNGKITWQDIATVGVLSEAVTYVYARNPESSIRVISADKDELVRIPFINGMNIMRFSTERAVKKTQVKNVCENLVIPMAFLLSSEDLVRFEGPNKMFIKGEFSCVWNLNIEHVAQYGSAGITQALNHVMDALKTALSEAVAMRAVKIAA